MAPACMAKILEELTFMGNTLGRTGGMEVIHEFSDPKSAAHFINHPMTSFMVKSLFLLTAKQFTVTSTSIDTGTDYHSTREEAGCTWSSKNPRNLMHVYVFNYYGMVRKIDL